jgi:hypothetical protein
LNFWDGIHQIVRRFLEQFRYMCPLLFAFGRQQSCLPKA